MANILVEPSSVEMINDHMQSSNLESASSLFDYLSPHRILEMLEQMATDPETQLDQLWDEVESVQEYVNEKMSWSQLSGETSQSESSDITLPGEKRFRSTPIVQTQYQNTYTYFGTLTAVIIFLLVSPTFQFFLYDSFNNFATINLVWFGLEYGIGIYVIIVLVGAENIQKIFMYASHYFEGISLGLIILNSCMFIYTLYYWMDEVEFDNHRNAFAENAHDLTSWEVLQTLPTIGYLALCYTFLVDVKAHYVAQDGSLTTLTLSQYITSAKAWIDSAKVWIDAWLATFYGWVYTFYFVWLNPVAWLQWVFQRVTEFVVWVRSLLPSN